MKPPNVIIEAYMPEETLTAFLQHIRDFDIAREGCHFNIVLDVPNTSVEEMNALLDSIAPGFAIRSTFRKS